MGRSLSDNFVAGWTDLRTLSLRRHIVVHEKIMHDHSYRWLMTFPLCLLLFAVGCGGDKMQDPAQSQVGQELERLRAENAELATLRADNQEVLKLRNDSQDIHKLRGQYQDLLRIRKENEQLRNQLAKIPAARNASTTPNQAASTPSYTPQPIANLVQSFDEAALALGGQEIREPDKPQEGDRILVDTNAIALLIPELLSTNAGPYEISGWLKSRGVLLKNYQQFNSLGITNYQVQRADPPAQNPATK